MKTAAGERAVDIVTDLRDARSRWLAFEAAAISTPFQSFLWASALFETVGAARGAEPYLVFVYEVRTRRDLMFAPFARRRVGPFRILEMVDFGVSDYSAPMVAPDIAAQPGALVELWRTLLAALPTADAIRVNRVPLNSVFGKSSFLQITSAWPKVTRSWAVHLPSKWLEYENGAITSKVRTRLRRGLKGMTSAGQTEYVIAQDTVEARKIFEALRAQRRIRFGKSDVLAAEEYRDFYWRVIERGLESGSSVLSAIKLDGDIIAAQFGLYANEIYYNLLPAMSPTAPSNWSLGKVLVWLHMKEMHGRGCRIFDFTIGDEDYKRDFRAEPNELFELACATRPQGIVFVMALQALAKFRRWRTRSKELPRVAAGGA